METLLSIFWLGIAIGSLFSMTYAVVKTIDIIDNLPDRYDLD